MSDLVAHCVMKHGLRERTTSAFLLVKHEPGSVLEGETGQSAIIRIVEVPSSTNSPIRIRPSQPDCLATSLVDRNLQLTPAQKKVGLIVQNLSSFDLSCGFGRCGDSIAFQDCIEFLIGEQYAPELFHSKALSRLVRVKGT